MLRLQIKFEVEREEGDSGLQVGNPVSSLSTDAISGSLAHPVELILLHLSSEHPSKRRLA